MANTGRSIDSVAPEVRSVAGLAGSTLLERYNALAFLAEELTPSECRILYSFLEEWIPEIEVKVVAGLKNEILHRLRQQEHLQPGWHKMLITIIENAGQHPVNRDYALQHLFTWYEHRLGESAFEAARQQMLRTMWSATEWPSGTIPGTAMLGLVQLGRQDSAVDLGRLSALAVRVAEDPNGDSLARTTALQIASQLEAVDVLEIARNLAIAAPELSLRVSAIAAVGKLGTSQDLSDLRNLEHGASGAAIRPALARAIRALESRTKG